MERVSFSSAVRGIVDSSDYTYADLARNLGVSRAAVSGMLDAQKSVSVSRAVKVASVLHFDVVLVPRGKKLPQGSIVLGEGENK